MPQNQDAASGEDAAESREETRKMRLANSTGWLDLTSNQTLPFVVDALLDAPLQYEFTTGEIAQRAGVSPQSVRTYIGILTALGIVESLDDTTPQRYRFNPEGLVMQEIYNLNNAINQMRSEGPGRLSGSVPVVHRMGTGTIELGDTSSGDVYDLEEQGIIP